jgi:hypothetical protein
VTKTVKVSDLNYKTLEEIRQTIIKEKIKTQLGEGKLERTDATFDEVISKLLLKQNETNQEPSIEDKDIVAIKQLLENKEAITKLLTLLQEGKLVHIDDPKLAKKLGL